MAKRGRKPLPIREMLVRLIERGIDQGDFDSIADLARRLSKNSQRYSISRQTLTRFCRGDIDLTSRHIDELMAFFDLKVVRKIKPGTVVAQKLIAGEDGLKRLGTITIGESKPAPNKKGMKNG